MRSPRQKESLAAGLSNSIESSDSVSVPSASSSSGPATVDSFGCEPEDSQEPGQQVNARVGSLLSKIKLPRPSDFAQSIRSRLTLLAGSAQAVLGEGWIGRQ